MVEEVFTRHGTPEHVVTDRGPQFTAQLFEKTSELLDTRHHKTTAYHPQSDRLVERLNQTLIQMIATYIDQNQRNWDDFIPYMLYAYHTAKNESTGDTPFYLQHARDPYGPYELQATVWREQYNSVEDYKQTMLLRFNQAFALA